MVETLGLIEILTPPGFPVLILLGLLVLGLLESLVITRTAGTLLEGIDLLWTQLKVMALVLALVILRILETSLEAINLLEAMHLL